MNVMSVYTCMSSVCRLQLEQLSIAIIATHYTLGVTALPALVHAQCALPRPVAVAVIEQEEGDVSKTCNKDRNCI